VKNAYTKREYKQATIARKMQNIIMFPSKWIMESIVDCQLITHCPVDRKDIHAANRLFGPIIAALKGKTTYGKGHSDSGTPNGVPSSILKNTAKLPLTWTLCLLIGYHFSSLYHTVCDSALLNTCPINKSTQCLWSSVKCYRYILNVV